MKFWAGSFAGLALYNIGRAVMLATADGLTLRAFGFQVLGCAFAGIASLYWNVRD